MRLWPNLWFGSDREFFTTYFFSLYVWNMFNLNRMFGANKVHALGIIDRYVISSRCSHRAQRPDKFVYIALHCILFILIFTSRRSYTDIHTNQIVIHSIRFAKGSDQKEAKNPISKHNKTVNFFILETSYVHMCPAIHLCAHWKIPYSLSHWNRIACFTAYFCPT